MSQIERFLLLDDDEANSLFFTVLLKEMGFEDVETTTSPTEGLKIIEAKKIQFIITAWELSPMPGTIFLQKARADRRRKFMPFLIYSKRMTEAEVQLTKDYGIKNILSMPFNRDQAREMIEKIIEDENNLDPILVKVRKMEAFLADNLPTEAVKLIDHTITKKSPYRAQVKTIIGECWLALSKLPKVEVSIQEALSDTPDYAPALSLKSKLLSRQGKHEEAIEILQKLSENSPLNLKTKTNLGAAYSDSGDHEKAKEVLGEVNSIDEDNQDAKDELGKIAFKEGDLNLAQQLLAETQNGEEMARYFNNMAITKVAAQQYEDGIETYHNAMRLLADKAKLNLLSYNLGLAYRKKGELMQSLEVLADCYAADPTFEKAYVGIARIVKELKTQGVEVDRSLIKKVKQAREQFKKLNPQKESA